MTDSLSELLKDIDLSADVFFTGGLCGLQGAERLEMASHLHFLKSGAMTVLSPTDELSLTAPCVIFIPDGGEHRLRIDGPDDAELVCATITFNAWQKARLVEILPRYVTVDASQEASLAGTIHHLFVEAFGKGEGRGLIINRLTDIFMVQLMRYVLDQGIISATDLAASSHNVLGPLMAELKARPADNWTVEQMAEKAAMSRSKFAALFKDIVGKAPMDYLTDIRIGKAQTLLRNNRPVALVANEVGYDDSSSLNRAFKKRLGTTPKQWLKSLLGKEG
ncbi:MAG: AraC family transcriptional regulator [Oceanospirillaceae bacterium]|uniref:AraC family transcriptional regulator n=1 Tax=unclassified Thalassolituus TaxID=2624967 RepID=UPI000C55D32E|nr:MULTISPECIES: AraC family transcriptional regulator [unclassified Thalassolituus]MAS26624.1 AraC family transcriptional regulator [Oceanospirillaceae bacterium]MAX99996.1 AraC family transcriptional regulator [Oceanospirillaceae bacterium]MBL35223.1 AraC family transcriptional regulator [Oceanospirillaceae bacterium]MBS51559.1 AraC family transcriptional regulator [Oceanospirillaceae bacterium]|tara:strand:- start:686 stop:1519 length:834 start_codon:yes stop_codon:yes gene_type:complete